VDSNGVGRFFTNGKGKAWLLQPAGVPRVALGKPLDWASVRITRFGPTGSIDLKTMRVRNPSSTITISVHQGRLRGI
jgi:hypothetical protein